MREVKDMRYGRNYIYFCPPTSPWEDENMEIELKTFDMGFASAYGKWSANKPCFMEVDRFTKKITGFYCPWTNKRVDIPREEQAYYPK